MTSEDRNRRDTSRGSERSRRASGVSAFHHPLYDVEGVMDSDEGFLYPSVFSGAPDGDQDAFKKQIDKFLNDLTSADKSELTQIYDKVASDAINVINPNDDAQAASFQWAGRALSTKEFSLFKRELTPDQVMTSLRSYEGAEDGVADRVAWQIRARILLPLIKTVPAYKPTRAQLAKLSLMKGYDPDVMIIYFLLSRWKTETRDLSNEWISATGALGFGQILQSNFRRTMAQPHLVKQFGLSVSHNDGTVGRRSGLARKLTPEEVYYWTNQYKYGWSFLNGHIWSNSPASVMEYLNWNVMWTAEVARTIGANGIPDYVSRTLGPMSNPEKVLAAMMYYYHNGPAEEPVNKEVRKHFPDAGRTALATLQSLPNGGPRLV